MILLLVLGATLARPAPRADSASTSPGVSAVGPTASSPMADAGSPSTPASSTSPAATEQALAALATPAAVSRPEQATAALGALSALPVKGRAPKTGYSRADFGDPWSDDVTVAGGHNGCDTRNDILRRDLVSLSIKPDSMGCTVASGRLTDPYTGRTIDFSRGGASEAVQIDHVVALGDAWQTGAQQLSRAKRIDLANDPRNLQATDGPTNQGKGDGDAATWLPPNRSYRCTYVARQVEVKRAYHLWLTAAERQAIGAVLRSCGGTPPVPLPTAVVSSSTTTTSRITAGTPAPAVIAPTSVSTSAALPTPPIPLPPPTRVASTPPPAPAAPEPTIRPAPVVTADPTTVSTSSPDSPTSDSNDDSGGAVYYKNCAAARAAGVAPLLRGSPGYRSGLDRDHDGVACER